MKKLSIFAITFFISFALHAQGNANADTTDQKHKLPRQFKQEIRIGAGYFTYPLLSEISFANQKRRELFIAMKPESGGVYSFGFHSFVNDEWNIGINFSLETINGRIERDVYDSTAFDTVRAFSNYKVKVISIFPSAYKYWKQSKMLNLYSGVGIGISLKSYDISGNLDIGKTEDTQISFSFQATALGIRYGNKYAVFAELGFGTLGIARVGFSAGF